MHDIKTIRDDLAGFRTDLLRRKPDEAAADALIAKLVELDDARKNAIQKAQAAQERRNAASKEIGAAMKAKDAALAEKLKAEVAELKETMGALEAAGARGHRGAGDGTRGASPTARCRKSRSAPTRTTIPRCAGSASPKNSGSSRRSILRSAKRSA